MAKKYFPAGQVIQNSFFMRRGRTKETNGEGPPYKVILQEWDDELKVFTDTEDEVEAWPGLTVGFFDAATPCWVLYAYKRYFLVLMDC